MTPEVAYAASSTADRIFSGLGQALKSAEDRKMFLEKLALEQRALEEQERMNRFNMASTTRNQNIAGIGMLADMRAQAMERHKRDMFKNDLWRIL